MEIREGYKQTEIGVIPEDWACEFIKDEYAIIDGDNIESGTLSDLNFYYITLENIDKGRLIGLIEIKYDNAPSRARRKVKKGDVLIGTVRPNLMSHYYVREDVKNLVCSTGFSVVRAFPEKLCGEFIYHNLFAKIINKQIERILVGSSYPAINSKDIKNILFPLPPLPEQQAIATALSDIDGLINSLQKLIDKKKKIKQGAMQELLTGKRRLEGFSGEWEVKTIGELFALCAGGDLNKEIFNTFKTEKHKYEVYANALAKKGLYGYTTLSKYPSNSITVTARGSIGFAFYRNQPYDAIGRLLVLIPKYKINCFFVSEYINNRVKFAIESTGVPQLTAPQIAKYELKIPPTIEEQTAIANILSDMDREIEALERKLNKYKDIKQGMMQELLTGRIRLLEEAVP
jgi:type I restriction enzyme S subunit